MELNNIKSGTFCFLSVEDLRTFAEALLRGQEELIKQRADDRYITAAEAAKLLKVTRVCIYNWGKKGIIRPMKVGKRTLFSKADIEAKVEKGILKIK